MIRDAIFMGGTYRKEKGVKVRKASFRMFANFPGHDTDNPMESREYQTMFENEDRHWWFQGTRSVILDVARNVLAPKEDATLRILDVGCGTGATLRVLSAFGEAHGLEPDGQAVAHCHKRGLESVVQGRAEDLPYEDDFFDVLVALDVLEHLEDDRAALKEMKRVVRPGGASF